MVFSHGKKVNDNEVFKIGLDIEKFFLLRLFCEIFLKESLKKKEDRLR